MLAQWIALFVINMGLRANNTPYNLGDVVSLSAQGGTGGDSLQHLYFCSLAGITAPVQPQYNGVPGEVILDGTATFVELSPTLDSGIGVPAGLAEVTGGSYARVKANAGAYAAMADWAGTQAPLSTTASTGTTGTTSNNNTITFPGPTAPWAAAPAMIALGAIMDQQSGGNMRAYMAMPTPKSVNSGDAAPVINPTNMTFQVDN